MGEEEEVEGGGERGREGRGGEMKRGERGGDEERGERRGKGRTLRQHLKIGATLFSHLMHLSLRLLRSVQLH